MNAWKTGALVVAIAAAAGLDPADRPAHAQARAAQAPRVFELFTGYSWIGVSIRELSETDAKAAAAGTSGVVVEDVTPESPAERAGIRKGDVILEFDGERVRSVRQFRRLVQETPSGRTVQTALLRDGQRTTVSVIPGEGGRLQFNHLDELAGGNLRVVPRRAVPVPPTPPLPPQPADRFLDQSLGRTNRLGITVSSLSSQLAEYFGAKQCVLVTSVQDDSVAAKAGIKAGDVITALNGSNVDAPADVRRRLQELNDGDELTVSIIRERKPLTLKGKIEGSERRRTNRVVV